MNKQTPLRLNEWRPIDALGTGYPPAPSGRCRVVAIGNFDGAHRGHRAVAAAARALATRLATPANARPEVLALTFEPHPRQFFQPDRPHFRLVPAARRAEALARIGFDGAVILPFTATLAGLSPEAFVRDILVGKLHLAGVVVGADFHFGKARAGTPDFLISEGARLGFSVELVPPFRDAAGAVIGSSAIRAALGRGDLAEANAMLGYPFSVAGPVIHGEKRGRDLGYPTANIRLDPAFGLAHGIYAVRVTIDGRVHRGVASFGRRPHFDNGAPLLETHVFDFSGDLYGREIEVAFIGYLRGEAKFDSLEALIRQMDADSLEARAILETDAAPL
jgi:riboflavin kinase / FMN adenylyltransferase